MKTIRKTYREDSMFRLSASVVADVSSEVQRVDFSAEVLKLRNANADAIFAYCLEEESARFLNQLRKQGYDGPLIGESTLISYLAFVTLGFNFIVYLVFHNEDWLTNGAFPHRSRRARLLLQAVRRWRPEPDPGKDRGASPRRGT
jgi:ABC-type branched-subunit amino acid transport system substrate-binding protein